MDNFENNIFSDGDNKLFNDYFNSPEKDQYNISNINSENNNNIKNDININDLNINEEDELKNFAESLNRGDHSNSPSSFFFSQNLVSDYNTNKSNKTGNLLDNYTTRLKNFGFPELGSITLSSDPKEQEKTFKFFDYIILKKANNLDDYQKYKRSNDLLQKKCEDLESQISKYKKELNNLKNQIKANSKEKTDYEFKASKLKDYYEKLVNKTKKENIYLNNKINKVLLEKRSLEEKYQTLTEMLNKYDFNKTKIINSIEITEYIQKNNIGKMISKVKGAEKLAATLKGGYNDSLRELLFEISALKNFIYDYHLEIVSLLDNYEDLDKELLNMSFLDTVSNVKDIFNINMRNLKQKFGFLENDEINFNNLDNCLGDEKIDK